MSDDLPELATNADWRGIMKRARKAHDGMTQGELAAAVRRLLKSDEPSQAMISKIESGASSTSTFIKPICDVLGIALPDHFVNKDDRDWVRLGRVLRARDMDQYKKWLAILEDVAGKEVVEELERDAAPSELPTPKSRKSRERRAPDRK